MNLTEQKNTTERKIPELLAPAGDFASFLGAINAGADAVYLAGEKFGARAYANNFSKDEILDAILYAHLHGSKVYLTVNTKTKLREGKELFEYLNPLYEAGLDGVIVQDYGVFSYIHEAFPELPLHVSTQMCVTSYPGAKYLKDKGACRIVPARELTLPEIKEINDLGIETECFIHGSMCYSYSGLCLFSSFLGERSGNRGRCAGPCRQPYCMQGERDEKYLLSLKDMCTIQFLPKLIDAGISSFKIEGRMKSPAYAAGVTRIYRKYIDSYLNDPKKPYRVSNEDLEELKHLYLRTDLQTGYYEKTSSASMVSITSPSYNKTDEALSASIIDQYCRNKVPVKINVSVRAICEEPFTLRFVNPYTSEEEFIQGNTVDVAQKAPITKEDLISRLRKSSLGLFSFETDSIEISDNAFIPVGAINNLRRQAEERVKDSLIVAYARTFGSEIPGFWDEEPYVEGHDTNPKPFVIHVQSVSSFDAILPKTGLNDILAFPVEWIENDEILKTIGKEKDRKFRVILPYVYRSPMSDDLTRQITKCETLGNIEGYYANQIDSLAFLQSLGVKKSIYGDYGLYTANPKAIAFLRPVLSNYTCDVELNKTEIAEEHVPGGEFIVYGRIPLMQTANCVKKTSGKCNHTEEFVSINDRTGAIFSIYTHCTGKICYNTIYNSVPLSLHKQSGDLDKAFISAMQIRFTDETKEECIAVLHTFMSLREGGEADYIPSAFTKGHYKKSVL